MIPWRNDTKCHDAAHLRAEEKATGGDVSVDQWAPRIAWEPHNDLGGSMIRLKYLKLKLP